jgi:hypothetical protein
VEPEKDYGRQYGAVDTLEGLKAQLGIAKGNLSAEIAKYHGFYASGEAACGLRSDKLLLGAAVVAQARTATPKYIRLKTMLGARI